MELDELRIRINEIDDEIAKLFCERMEVCSDVAKIKKAASMPIFQQGREKDVLKRIADEMPEELKSSSDVLYQTIMDISKCLQYRRMLAQNNTIPSQALDLNQKFTCAVPGTQGSFSQMACNKLLPNADITFCDVFEGVFDAVESGKTDLGVVPIANSTAGSVSTTYELLKKYDLKICAATKLKVEHCLCAKKGTRLEDITIVYSHEQALMQCSGFIKKQGCKAHKYSNTALAAQYAAQSSEPVAAICSADSAQRCGLEIIARDIADASENYTRFIVIAKQTLCTKNADIVSVSLSLAHEKNSLYRLLTKFSVAGLNLLMIESRPIANTDFDVVFYIDFQGSINDEKVAMLINELSDELGYFKFLGNYEEI